MNPADMYVSIIRSVLEYACEVWHPGLTREQSNTLEHLPVRALNVAYPELNYRKALNEGGIVSLKQRRSDCCRKFSLILQSPVTNLIIYFQSKEFKLESGMLGLTNHPRSELKDLKTHPLIMVCVLIQLAVRPVALCNKAILLFIYYYFSVSSHDHVRFLL